MALQKISLTTPAADGSGNATVTSSQTVTGKVQVVLIDYQTGQAASINSNTAVVVATNSTPVTTIISGITEGGGGDAVYYPRVAACGTDGVALTFDTGDEVPIPIPLVQEQIKITVSGANQYQITNVQIVYDS